MLREAGAIVSTQVDSCSLVITKQKINIPGMDLIHLSDFLVPEKMVEKN